MRCCAGEPSEICSISFSSAAIFSLYSLWVRDRSGIMFAMLLVPGTSRFITITAVDAPILELCKLLLNACHVLQRVLATHLARVGVAIVHG